MLQNIIYAFEVPNEPEKCNSQVAVPSFESDGFPQFIHVLDL